MTALDVAARGLAAGVKASLARIDDGSVSMSARAEPDAASLEELAALHSVLVGRAGEEYLVETSPFIRPPAGERLIIQGNGATLRNTNATPLSVSDVPQRTFMPGTSTVNTTGDFTFYAVSDVSGPVITVGDAAANFIVGDIAILHGASHYPTSEGDVFTNYLRANVVAVTTDTVALDRALTAELIADFPVVATSREQVASGIAGLDHVYLLNGLHVENLTIRSDCGNPVFGGGCIDGVFRDVRFLGRTGPSFNAMQDCLLDGIRFVSWRKIAELAEGSLRTVVRNVRGVMEDSSEKCGGSPDGGVFFMGIHENSAECVFEDFNVSSGPNDAGSTANACQLGAGRDNTVRASRLAFPEHTGCALAIQSRSDAASIRCGYENVTVIAPVCSVFLNCADPGGGLEGPYCIASRFAGNPTSGAAILAGANGRLLGNVFAAGNVQCNGAMSGWRIEGNEINGDFTFPANFTGNRVTGNFIRGGFANVSDSMLRSNDIRDNDSDANRSLRAAAVVDEVQSANITATAAYTPRWSMVCPAGTLEQGDRIVVRARLTGGYVSGGTRFAALSVATATAGRKGCGSTSIAAGGDLSIESELVVTSDTAIMYRTTIGGVQLATSVAVVDSLSSHDLTLNVEAWVSGAGVVVVPYGCRVIPIKRGMRHLPL